MLPSESTEHRITWPATRAPQQFLWTPLPPQMLASGMKLGGQLLSWILSGMESSPIQGQTSVDGSIFLVKDPKGLFFWPPYHGFLQPRCKPSEGDTHDTSGGSKTGGLGQVR